jgi:N-dimethylarginine dimethylaminohydrolase
MNIFQEHYENANRRMTKISCAKKMPSHKFDNIHKLPKECNLHDWETPMFAMTSPNFSYIENDYPLNNDFMADTHKDKGEIYTDKELMWYQWQEVYSLLSQFGLVFVEPSSSKKIPDLVFTSNAGMAMPNHIAKNTIILSNFRSKPRARETLLNKQFFESLGYECIMPPHFFEGFADLKYLKDNIFIGGYGIRTQIETYEWLQDNFDMQILPVRVTDPYQYHFDCNCFIVDNQNIICSSNLRKEDIAAIEKLAEVHMVSREDAKNTSCNIIQLGGTILAAEYLDVMEEDDPEFAVEAGRIKRLEEIANKIGYNIVFMDMSALDDFGAAASCLVMPLNYYNIEV